MVNYFINALKSRKQRFCDEKVSSFARTKEFRFSRVIVPIQKVEFFTLTGLDREQMQAEIS